MNERRHNSRVLIRRAVDFLWDGGAASGWGHDLGMNGMYIQSGQRLAPGTAVHVTVHFRRAKPISVDARVRRMDETGFAVEFERLGGLADEIIRKVIGYAG
ncbi:MAG: PilZ domain-containing protein [Polyangiaceae bacterium]|nr:PilZ domain-containing protein [Polyangiaceae bacterium]